MQRAVIDYSDMMLRRVAAACSCTSGSALLRSETTFGLQGACECQWNGRATWRQRRGDEHGAGLHQRSFDLRVEGKVAYCGDAVLQHHAFAGGQKLDQRRQDAGLVSSKLHVCDRGERARGREVHHRRTHQRCKPRGCAADRWCIPGL